MSVRVEAVLSLDGYLVTTPPPSLVAYSSSLSLSTTKDRPNMPSINWTSSGTEEPMRKIMNPAYVRIIRTSLNHI